PSQGLLTRLAALEGTVESIEAGQRACGPLHEKKDRSTNSTDLSHYNRNRSVIPTRPWDSEGPPKLGCRDEPSD
ncbi:MAG: hypothetical protein KGQ51_20125, partial [Planctomycetes bacterium]|nr:hypothetical protein [Planctomycetota bacterium]